MAAFTISKVFNKLWQPQTQIVRNRYWKDHIAKNVIRRYGYKDEFFYKGLLPRHSELEKLKNMKIYRPVNTWHEKRALFGQNDYIDILGDGTMHPAKIVQNVPDWLKEFKGNEYERLMREMKTFGHITHQTRPYKWKKMLTRFEQLYYFFNYRQIVRLPKT